MPLVLEPLAGGGALSIDFTGIVPDRVANLPPAGIARLPIQADERPAALGDLFRVAGSPADRRIECRGDFSRVHFIGAAMAGGEIIVDGPAGRHAAAGLAGGTLTIRGDAGDWLACEMAGGEVRVAGGVGDNAASALPGSPHGMRGGLVTIAGDAGSLAGSRMRRGILAIGGDCGPAAAFEMRAGSVVVGGTVGPHAGSGMRRGSLIAMGPAFEPSAMFRRGAAWSPAFMPLVEARLAAAGFRPRGDSARGLLGGLWQHWHGDQLNGGRGEIFTRAAA